MTAICYIVCIIGRVPPKSGGLLNGSFLSLSREAKMNKPRNPPQSPLNEIVCQNELSNKTKSYSQNNSQTNISFSETLEQIRSSSLTEREKGARFEKLIAAWFRTDPRYSYLARIWSWDEFPFKNDISARDMGIDLVAETSSGEYWAIQCKCYAADKYIGKPDIDSFLSASSKYFKASGEKTKFALRVFVSTSRNWNDTANEAIQNQDPPVMRIGLNELENSHVNWAELLNGKEGTAARQAPKIPKEHQSKAVAAAKSHYRLHDRGKMIMACGTGKTYTALLVTQELLKDKIQRGDAFVLMLVPSIALVGQTLKAWCDDAAAPLHAVCVCSDAKVSKKKADDDSVAESVVDLAHPASTNAKNIVRQILQYQNQPSAAGSMTVVFSTYQSIDAVSAAQKELLTQTNGKSGAFDLIICDEAHRTTGVKVKNAEDDSYFVRVHSDEYIVAQKRLYMTATPRIYLPNAKERARASEQIDFLYSMDDENQYGVEFYNMPFSEAVEKGLLTDYKVLILSLSPNDLTPNLVDLVKNAPPAETSRTKTKAKDAGQSEDQSAGVATNYDDTSKLQGILSALSKNLVGDDGRTWEVDPGGMRRAVAFCSKIGTTKVPGSSTNIAALFPLVSQKVHAMPGSRAPFLSHPLVQISAKHIDGSMGSQKRDEILSWLKADSENPHECKVLCNVRCLSEGVDVPSLDAVMFLSPRNSQVDIVQSVGRVMRNFKKGEVGEKKYGYIIIPIVAPEGVSPEEALNQSEAYSAVWSILNALRTHDDRFEAKIQQINLNRAKEESNIIIAKSGIGKGRANDVDSEVTEGCRTLNESPAIGYQLHLDLETERQMLYARLVEKCGTRLYWENWARDIGTRAQKFIDRIQQLLDSGKYQQEFDAYLQGLKNIVNPSVDKAQAIEMLAQHMIAKPVFDALFGEYKFIKNNPIGQSMESVLDLFYRGEAFQNDLEYMSRFYDEVKRTVGRIDNLEGRQTIIKTIYNKFFSLAFPKTMERLGIVYTPVECVDFILHSVEALMKREFNRSLSDENVHILDPFVGTGTFITRLLQSGIIEAKDMERKYLRELHCNEIVLLPYYVADVNIETVFHSLTQRKTYQNYANICLTDTFELYERDQLAFNGFFKDNTEQIERQRQAPIQVIIGNPPYSVGQKNANDNNQNLKYDKLDEKIAKTYAAGSNSTNKNAMYDSYIRAFRWASDRIAQNPGGGMIGFITNGKWIDANTSSGFRKSLADEFDSIYVLDLKGGIRGKDKEGCRKAGGNVFDVQVGICMTFLVKNSPRPTEKASSARIFYTSVDDYTTREDKLKYLKDNKYRFEDLDWQAITPDEHGDWLNQRLGGEYDQYPRMGDKKDKTGESDKVFCDVYSRGLATSRDAWCYGYSKENVLSNMKRSISFFNQQLESYKIAHNMDSKLKVEKFIDVDPTKISWSRAYRENLARHKPQRYSTEWTAYSSYRPFVKQFLYYDKDVLNDVGPILNMFPYGLSRISKVHQQQNDSKEINRVICINGLSSRKANSCIMTNCIPDLNVMEAGTQCFPLYVYEAGGARQQDLFGGGQGQSSWTRRSGITGWILERARKQYGRHEITEEDIFYYVYGMLHCPQYREKYQNDFKKALPRIPFVEKYDDFVALMKAGRELGDLHCNYEQCPMNTTAQIVEDGTANYLIDKLRPVGKGHFTELKYNSHITITNIPPEAHEYIVNGRSPLGWLIDQYQVSVDKDSKIKNDPNDWCREHNNPRYILELILRVIEVSVRTVRIVKGLPNIE